MSSPNERLREWRAKRSLRLVDVAAVVGCGVAWLSMLERGLKAPGSLRLVRAIESLTGIDADEWPATARKPRKKRNEAA